MKMKSLAWLPLIVAAMMFAGCSSTGTKGEGTGASVDDRGGSGSGTGAQTSGIGPGGAGYGNPLDDPRSAVYEKTVYFDFDRSEIRAEFVSILRAHAEYLNNNRAVNVTIEGHCDERGSREYNIGLGERRANAVMRFLEAEGVDRAQLNSISYGEERPADLGHDEMAWSQNRRGVLVY